VNYLLPGAKSGKRFGKKYNIVANVAEETEKKLKTKCDHKMKTAIVWFKNDLRVQDNASLHKAIKENDRVIAAYFFDPRLFAIDKFGFNKTARYRAKFLLETVSELNKNLATFNISLLIFQQQPETVFPRLISNYNITSVYLQKEWTAAEVAIINKVKESVSQYTIQFIETYDQFLFHPQDLPFDGNAIPQVFTVFRKKCEKYCEVRQTVTVTKLSANNKIDNQTTLPSIESLGFENFVVDNRTAFPYKGGETQSLKRLQHYFWDSQKLSYYKKTRNGLLGKDYSSKFSAWLANGSISAKIIYHQIKNYEREIQKNESTYWLIFELIWRDYFKYISLKHGNNIFKLGGIFRL